MGVTKEQHNWLRMDEVWHYMERWGTILKNTQEKQPIREKFRLKFKLNDLEQSCGLEDSGGAAHLSDGVHGQLRSTNIQHRNSQPSCQDGPNGCSTGTVVPHHHVLRNTAYKTIVSTQVSACGGILIWMVLPKLN